MSEIGKICHTDESNIFTVVDELMRGRKPECLSLRAKDILLLQQIARSQVLPWYQVCRARIVLAIAEGQRVQTVAFQMQCAPRTVSRTCLQYQTRGLSSLLAPIQRPGRPARLSPPATGTNCTTGLSGTGGNGLAYYPLVEQ